MFVHDKEQIVLEPVRVGKWHALAEAIREGCKLLPKQCFGQFFGKEESSACALGAASFAVWKDREYNPELYRGPDATVCPIRTNCSLGDLYPNESFAVIPHLNDDHRWTREAIADWLDTL